MGRSVGRSADVSVGLSVGLSADVSMDTSTDKSVGFAMGLSTGVAVGISVLPQLAVVRRGCLLWLAVEIAVKMAMASTMGLYGIPLLAAAFRRSPWSVRGSPWSVRGCPLNGVEIAVECRGGQWALPQLSAKKTNNVHPSAFTILTRSKI